MISTKDLRQLAAQATLREWQVGDGEKDSFYQGQNAVISKANRVIAERSVYNYHCPSDFDKQTFADLKFIAAANPQTVIALLDRLDKLETVAKAAKAYRDGIFMRAYSLGLSYDRLTNKTDIKLHDALAALGGDQS